MEKVRIGIIGYGVQGKFYSAILTGAQIPGMPPFEKPEGCVLTAISSRQEPEAKIPGVRYFTDWKALVCSDACDAVVITTPHYCHAEMTEYALEKGKHVLCEKPAAVRAGDAQRMVDAARRNPGCAFALMLNQRTGEVYRKLHAIIHSGELGQLRRSNWIINNWWRPDSYYASSPWRGTWAGEGGGVLVNQAPHQLDLWLWLCGKPKKLFAKCIQGAHRNIGVENDVTILTEYENGATGCFITCTHDVLGTDRLELDFSKGKIVVENSTQATVCRFIQDEAVLNRSLGHMELAGLLHTAPEKLYSVQTIAGSPQYGAAHGAIFANFARHILHGEPLIAPGEEGVAAVQLANTAQLSGWLGKELDFPCDSTEYDRLLREHIKNEQ